MREVWRADRHRVDAILARSFACNQILIGAVAAGGIQPLANGEFAAALWVDVKRARYELPFAVEARGETMDVADIGALSAAHHAETQGSLSVHQSSSPSMARLVLRSAPDFTKSSNARSETRMIWSAMKRAPSAGHPPDFSRSTPTPAPPN